MEATNADGRQITAWVRAVRHGPGSWSVSGLEFGGTADAQVSEAVASVLESRRPTMALRAAGDLVEKHRQRLADLGVMLGAVRSSWIAAVGYSDTDGLLTMQTRTKTDADGHPVLPRTYGSHVPREVFEQLAASDRPGTIYNRLVKGHPSQLVKSCRRCGRVYAASRSHVCGQVINDDRTLPPQSVDEATGRRSALGGIRRRRGLHNRAAVPSLAAVGRLTSPVDESRGEPDE